MKPRPLFVALALLLVSSPLAVRAADTWDYDKLKSQADLIVIATPLTVVELDENTVLPGIQRMGPEGKVVSVAAVGQECSFAIEVVLKGDWDRNRLVFHYLREATPPTQPVKDGPLLVSFDPKKKLRYLMFLKLDKDGRLESVTGQTDPGLSIKELGPTP